MFATLLTRLIPFKATALCVLLAALAGGLIVQGAQLKAAHATVTAKNESIAALQALLAAQNAGIESLKAEATKRETEAKKAAALVKTVQERARARVASIEAAPVPQDCQGAVQWLVTEGAKLEAQP